MDALNWHDFKKTLRFSAETANHPHSPSESADLFSSTSFESTEVEYLDLIHSLVLAKKPGLILETGSHHGMSAIAIAFALKQNSHNSKQSGRLVSLEENSSRADIARSTLDQLGLSPFVATITAESMSYLTNEYSGPPFEVVYFDSSRAIRGREFEVLRSRSLLAPAALLLFHDTSVHRAQSLPGQRVTQEQYLAALDHVAQSCAGRIVFSLSRGFTVMQIGSTTSVVMPKE